MKTTKKILLTGATGSVGYEVLSLLASEKMMHVIVFDIKNSRTIQKLEPFKNNVEIIYGSLTNKSDVLQIPAHIDVAIHLAAIIPPLSDRQPELAQHVNVEGTKLLIQHLENTSPDAFFLFSSSIAIYGDRLLRPFIRVGDLIDESTSDIYARTKIDCENIIRHSSLKWSIFRLTAIMKNHKISPLMFHMPLSTTIEICTAQDTARAFVSAIEKKEILSFQTFNLGGGELCRITYRDFLVRSFRIYGLGALNFPERAFAEYHFHCGIYADGDVLEELLHFRKDSTESYFAEVKKDIPRWKYFLGTIFRTPVKIWLLLQSEPYRAYRTHNQKMITHFFLPNKKIPMTTP